MANAFIINYEWKIFDSRDLTSCIITTGMECQYFIILVFL